MELDDLDAEQLKELRRLRAAYGFARVAITNSVSDTIRVAIDNLGDAKAAWDYLQTTYGRTNPTAIDHLKHQLQTLNVKPPTVTNVFAQVERLVVQLAEAGAPVEPELIQRTLFKLCGRTKKSRMCNFLDTLEWALARETRIMPLDQLKAELLDRELLIDLQSTESGNTESGGLRRQTAFLGENRANQSPAPASTTASSRNAIPQTNQKTANQKKPNPGKPGTAAQKDQSDAKPVKKCYNCGKSGHILRDCRTFRKALLAYEKGQNNDDEDPQCAGFAALATISFRAYALSKPGAALEWVHDGGATVHMSCKADDFVDLTPLNPPHYIGGIKNSRVEASHIGTIRVHVVNRLSNGKEERFPLTLQDAYYAPTLGARLFAGGAAAQKGIYSDMRAKSTIVHNNGQQLFSCPRDPRTGLYFCPFIDRMSGTNTDCENTAGGDTATLQATAAPAVTAPLPTPSPTVQEAVPPQATKPTAPGVTAKAMAPDPEHPWFNDTHQARTDWNTWHQRFGHLNIKDLATAERQGMVSGFLLTAGAHIGFPKATTCTPCILGKSTRSGNNQGGRRRATRPLELLHTDLCHYPVTSNTGKDYLLSIVDDFSGFSFGHFLKTKDEAASRIIDQLRFLRNKFPQYPVATLRSDDGGELRTLEFKSFLADLGVEHQVTTPYDHGQNGVVERRHRTINDGARSILVESGLPHHLWTEAVGAKIHAINRSPYATVRGSMTPFEALYGYKPDVSHLRVFGCRVFANIPEELRINKLDPRAQPGIFVGYHDTTKGYRMLLPTGRILVRRSLRFNEAVLPYGDSAYFNEAPAELPTEEENSLPASPAGTPPPASTDSTGDNTSDEEDYLPLHSIYTGNSTRSGKRYSSLQHAGGGKHTKRDAKTLKKTTFNFDQPPGPPPGPFAYLVAATDEAATALLSNAGELVPRTYKEALATAHATQWLAAMEAEVSSLDKMGVATVVPRPTHKKVIKARWVFATKLDNNNNISRWKARFVAKGFTQTPNEDFFETFAPTSTPGTVRYIIADAASRGRTLVQCDVTTAYLNAPLLEEVYVEMPPGFNTDTTRVWKLNKCLYGLKQSARGWNDTLATALATIGFKNGPIDPCLFVRQVGKVEDYLTVHVDDIKASSNNKASAAQLITDIKTLFDIKVNTEAEPFLGVESTISADGSIKIHQSAYAQRVLARFNMSECAPVTTPWSSDTLSKDQCPSTKEEAKEMEKLITTYRAIIGSLNYIAVWTRPDLMLLCNELAKFGNNPGMEHYKALKRGLRYLRGTTDRGITYVYVPNLSRQDVCNSLSAYVDASFASDHDTRRSTSGWYICLYGRAILWGSKLQKSVAVSTAESEYVAAATALKDILWYRQLQAFLGHPPTSATTIHEDNQAAIKISQNPEMMSKTKHMQIKFHAVRERVMDGTVDLIYVETKEQAADMMTKHLPAPALRHCLDIVT